MPKINDWLLATMTLSAMAAVLILAQCSDPDSGTYHCSRSGGVYVHKGGGTHKCEYPNK